MKTKYCFARDDDKAYLVILSKETVTDFKKKYYGFKGSPEALDFIKKHNITNNYIVLRPYAPDLDDYYLALNDGTIEEYELLIEDISIATNDDLEFSPQLQEFMNKSLNDPGFMMPPTFGDFIILIKEDVPTPPGMVSFLLSVTTKNDFNKGIMSDYLDHFEREVLELIFHKVRISNHKIEYISEESSCTYSLGIEMNPKKTSNSHMLDIKALFRNLGVTIIDSIETDIDV